MVQRMCALRIAGFRHSHCLQDGRMRRTHLLLILIIAVYIALRFGLIFFGYSHISHPYFDEPVSGTLTFDLLQESLRAPLMAYQYEQRSGDMMLEAFLMYPLAAVFGHSMFTIKLFALLCGLLCMLGWVYCINRYCGMKAALLFALLFALPPPMFARLSLVGTFSSHHMINLILVIQLLCLFRMLEKDAKHVSGAAVACIRPVRGAGYLCILQLSYI